MKVNCNAVGCVNNKEGVCTANVITIREYTDGETEQFYFRECIDFEPTKKVN